MQTTKTPDTLENILKTYTDIPEAIKKLLNTPGYSAVFGTYTNARTGVVHRRLLVQRDSDAKLFDYRISGSNKADECWVTLDKWNRQLGSNFTVGLQPITPSEISAGIREKSSPELQVYSSIASQNSKEKQYAALFEYAKTAVGSQDGYEIALCKSIVGLLSGESSFADRDDFKALKEAANRKMASDEETLRARNFLNAALYSGRLSATDNFGQVRTFANIFNEATIESQRQGITDTWRLLFKTPDAAQKFADSLNTEIPGMGLLAYRIVENPRYPETAKGLYALDFCLAPSKNNGFVQPAAHNIFTSSEPPLSIYQLPAYSKSETTPSATNSQVQLPAVEFLPNNTANDKLKSAGEGTQAYSASGGVFYTPYFEKLGKGDQATIALLQAIYDRASALGIDASSLLGADHKDGFGHILKFLNSDNGQNLIACCDGKLDVVGWATMEAIYHGTAGSYAYFGEQFVANLKVAEDRANRVVELLAEICSKLDAGKARLAAIGKGNVYFYQALSPELLAKVQTEGFSNKHTGWKTRKYNLSEFGYSPETSQQHLNMLMKYLETAENGKYANTYNLLINGGKVNGAAIPASISFDGTNYSIKDTRTFMHRFMVKRSEVPGIAKKDIMPGMTEAIVLSGIGSGIGRGYSFDTKADIVVSAEITSLDSANGVATITPGLTANGISLPSGNLGFEAWFQKQGERSSTRIPADKIRFENGVFIVQIPKDTPGKLIANVSIEGGNLESGKVWQSIIKKEEPTTKAPPPKEEQTPVPERVKANVPISRVELPTSRRRVLHSTVRLPGTMELSDDSFNFAFGQDEGGALLGIINSINVIQNQSPPGVINYLSNLNNWVDRQIANPNSPLNNLDYFVGGESGRNNFITFFRRGDFEKANTYLNPNNSLSESIGYISNASTRRMIIKGKDLYKLLDGCFQQRAEAKINFSSPQVHVVTVPSGEYANLKQYGFKESELNALSQRKGLRAEANGKSYVAVKGDQGQISVYELPSITGGINLYLQHDGYLLITGDKVDVASAGATLIASIPLAKGVRFEPSLEVAVQRSLGAGSQSLAIDSYDPTDTVIITPGARIEAGGEKLMAYVEGTLAASFNRGNKAMVDMDVLGGLQSSLWKGGKADIYVNPYIYGLNLEQAIFENDRTFFKSVKLYGSAERAFETNILGKKPVSFMTGIKLDF